MVRGGIDWEVESLEKKEEMRWKVNRRGGWWVPDCQQNNTDDV